MLLKHIACYFLMTLSVAVAFAQQPEVVKQYVDYEGKPTNSKYANYYTETYKTNNADPYWQIKTYYNDTIQGTVASVGKSTDSQGQIKEGSFIYYFKNGTKKSEGDYANNFKEGEWKEWNEAGNIMAVNHFKKGKMVGRNIRWYDSNHISDSAILDGDGNGKSFAFFPNGTKSAEGNYTSGSKNGQWLYYYLDIKNQKSIEVVYEMDSVKDYTCYTETGELQKKDCVFEREASFRGGDEGWKKYLIKKLTEKSRIYSKLLKPNQSYSVIVKFVVEKDGSIGDVKIEKKGIIDLDEIAWEIIQNSPDWIPAVQYNRKVRAYRRQPITFAGPE